MTIKQKLQRLFNTNKVYISYKVFLNRKAELNRIQKEGVTLLFNNHYKRGIR